MYLLGKHVNDLTVVDLERLLQNDIREGITLEYKKLLNINDSKEKNRQEFLYDLTAMYNTDGGCIIYGIEERKDDKGDNTGYPAGFINQEMSNTDKLEQQIHDIVRSNTDPMITNFHIKFLTVQSCDIIIIGIPKGIGLPAMVTYNDVNKFYKRNSVGKYAVKTLELNHLFMQNNLIKQSSNQFRITRTQEVRSNSIIPTLLTQGSYFLHIIPFSFLEERIVDLKQLELQAMEDKVYPILNRQVDSTTEYNHIYNLDGFMTYRTNRESKQIFAYNQYFRNGIIEIFTTSFNYGDENYKIIYGTEIILQTFMGIQRSLQTLKILKIEPPFIVYVSLFDTLNHTLLENSTVIGKFTRDNILLPPVLFDEPEVTDIDIFKRMKIYFDIIWQAAGSKECPDERFFFRSVS
jgi:hypothetical protein